MRTESEIKAKRNEFENEQDPDIDDDELDTVLDALNWVLGEIETIDQYKPITIG